MSDVRVGIVGAGANTTTKHIPLLQAIDGVEIVGVANRGESSSSAVAKRFGIPKTYGHWEQAVADPDTNAIVIGTWPYLHCPVTLAAIGAGKHVLTEARMAMNAAEARCMLDASLARPGLVAQVVPSPITLFADAIIQRFIAEGFLGQLLLLGLSNPILQFFNSELGIDTPLFRRKFVPLHCSPIVLGNTFAVFIFYA